MKLTEHKAKLHHYFGDEQGRKQGEYKAWYLNGQRWIICHYRNGKIHGECKSWNSTGELNDHVFYIDGKIIMNFIKNPELYPSTPEDKLIFVLKYGSAPFIGDK